VGKPRARAVRLGWAGRPGAGPKPKSIIRLSPKGYLISKLDWFNRASNVNRWIESNETC